MRANRRAFRLPSVSPEHLAGDLVHNQIVMPAKAGVQGACRAVTAWIPAFAGVTKGKLSWAMLLGSCRRSSRLSRKQFTVRRGQCPGRARGFHHQQNGETTQHEQAAQGEGPSQSARGIRHGSGTQGSDGLG